LSAALAEGALAVDVRPSTDFASAHRVGSLSVPLGNSFLSWAGSILPDHREIVLLAAPSQRDAADHAARELRLIGLDNVLGVLTREARPAKNGAPDAATLRRISVTELATEMRRGATVIDVRNRTEWEEGHVAGARNIPLPELTARLDELRDLGPIAVHCQGGSRSTIAASVLRAHGFVDVTDLTGGFAAWAQAGNTPTTGA
jgi:rhodanese-related sulfurtransferase